MCYQLKSPLKFLKLHDFCDWAVSFGVRMRRKCFGKSVTKETPFSEMKWKWSVSHSVMSYSAIPWTVANQAPLSMEICRQEYWSELPCPPPGDPPDSGIEPTSSMSPALAGGFFTTINSSCFFLDNSIPCNFIPSVALCIYHRSQDMSNSSTRIPQVSLYNHTLFPPLLNDGNH